MSSPAWPSLNTCSFNLMNIVDQLKRDEGVRLKPYRDSVGKLTIGIGRNLDDDGITEAEASYLLLDDLQRTQDALYTALPWVKNLDEVRRSVILNMAFNMGTGRLVGFKMMLNYLQAGNWMLASQEMLRSLWAKEVGERAQRLSTQLLSGTWQ